MTRKQKDTELKKINQKKNSRKFKNTIVKSSKNSKNTNR